jgi:hypothetical protein
MPTECEADARDEEASLTVHPARWDIDVRPERAPSAVYDRGMTDDEDLAIPKLPFKITLTVQSTVESSTGAVNESLLALLVARAITVANNFQIEVDGKRYDINVGDVRDVRVSRNGNVVSKAGSSKDPSPP